MTPLSSNGNESQFISDESAIKELLSTSEKQAGERRDRVVTEACNGNIIATEHNDIMKMLEMGRSSVEESMKAGFPNLHCYGMVNSGIQCTLFDFSCYRGDTVRYTAQWIEHGQNVFTLTYTYNNFKWILLLLMALRIKLIKATRELGKSFETCENGTQEDTLKVNYQHAHLLDSTTEVSQPLPNASQESIHANHFRLKSRSLKVIRQYRSYRELLDDCGCRYFAKVSRRTKLLQFSNTLQLYSADSNAALAEYNLIKMLPLTTVVHPVLAVINQRPVQVLVFPFVEQYRDRRLDPESVKKLILVSASISKTSLLVL